jgi:hypothetical protein
MFHAARSSIFMEGVPLQFGMSIVFYILVVHIIFIFIFIFSPDK